MTAAYLHARACIGIAVFVVHPRDVRLESLADRWWLDRRVRPALLRSCLLRVCLACDQVVWKLEDPAVLARERQQRELEQVGDADVFDSGSFDAE